MAVLGPRAGTAALLILVLFAGLPFVRPAQAERVLGLTWDRTYVRGLAGPYSTHQTSDGGFIMSGESSGAWVMKTNAAGMPEWQRRFIPSGYIDADGVIIPTNDGGYILVGSALPACCRGGHSAWLLKLDHRGGVEWSRLYGAPYDALFTVHQTSDGGYVAMGNTQSIESGHVFNAWILRLDSEGRLLWQKSFGAEGFAYPSSISQISDGGFVLAGRSNPASLNPLIGIWGPWLLKLDSSGNLVWQKMYGLGNSGLQEVHETMDGGLIAVGNEATDCCGHLVWAMKLDSGGNVRGCDVGFASNATLTDTSAIVASPSATSVDTPFTPSPTDVTVTRFMIMPQDQCRPKIDTV